MKKTLTINLGGIVYHIDDDAYRLLDNYLSNLKHYFRKQEGAEEIVNDIEMRIAELFAEKVTEGKQVIIFQTGKQWIQGAFNYDQLGFFQFLNNIRSISGLLVQQKHDTIFKHAFPHL